MKTLLAIIGALTLQAVAGLAAETNAGAIHHFRLTLVSKLTITNDGKPQLMTANSEICYSWQRKEKTRTLSLDSVSVKANLDGVELMNSFMSREKFTGKQ